MYQVLHMQEAARYLASVGIQIVDVDYLSVGGHIKDGVETHQALLEEKSRVAAKV